MINCSNLEEVLRRGYSEGEQDYHLKPLIKAKNNRPVAQVKNGDCVIFCCRRGDREVQLTDAFTMKGFSGFQLHEMSGLEFIPITLYQEKFSHLNILFPVIRPNDSLGEIVSKAGLRQLRVAESEKFAHVTFFFNGRRVEAFEGEDRVFIDSPPSSKLLENPGTSTGQVADAVIAGIGKGIYDFILANLASGDMVGHLEDYDAKVECASSVDASLGKILDAAIRGKYVVVITSDHGLLETGFSKDGKPNVSHTTAKVPFAIVAAQGMFGKSEDQGGTLSDVAPTVLSLMRLPKPGSMTGESRIVNNGYSHRVVLLVVDGWGLGVKDPAINPIAAAKIPNLDVIMSGDHFHRIEASGSAVGLPDGRYGNSEVGHLTIGSGRMIPSDELRIAKAVEDGSLAENPNLTGPMKRLKDRGGDLHLIIILSERSSHGNIKEGMAIADAAGKNGISEAFIHIILDGRSTPPQGAADLIPVLKIEGEKAGIDLEVATVMGREYALDRGGNYDKKTKVAYDALVDGIGKHY